MKRRLSAVLLALILVLGQAAWAASLIIFEDVPETHWAFPYIQQAYAQNIIGGTGTNPKTGRLMFEPANPISAKEIAVVFGNAFYAAETARMPHSSWYDAQYQVLVSHNAFLDMGVVDLNSSIPRYQLVLLAYNILLNLGIHAPSQADLDQVKASIPDWDSIPAASQPAVAATYHWKVFSGTGGGYFNPSSTTSRAEAVVVCLRMLKLLDDTLGDWKEPMPEPTPTPTPTPAPSQSPDPAESAAPSSSPAPSPEPSASPEPSQPGSEDSGKESETEPPVPAESQSPDPSQEPSGSPEESQNPVPADSSTPAPSPSHTSELPGPNRGKPVQGATSTINIPPVDVPKSGSPDPSEPPPETEHAMP